MARLVDESFEGTGYEESWSESGSPNEDSAGPGSLPAGGGSQCLTVSGSSDVYAIRDTGAARATSYTRAYIYFSALSLTSGTELILLQMRNGSSTNTMVLSAYHNGTSVVWRLTYHISAGWQHIVGSTPISTGQWYRVEFCKTSSGAMELRVDGATIGTASGVTLDRGDPQIWTVGMVWNGGTSATIYFDLVAIEDATWVGAEGGAAAASLVVPARSPMQSLLVR